MAQTGAILGSRCYSSQAEALDVLYSGIAPALSAGATGYVLDYAKISGVWHQRSHSVTEGGAWVLRSMSPVPTADLPACDPLEKFFDGLLLGWGLATVLVAVAAVTFIKRGVRGG